MWGLSFAFSWDDVANNIIATVIWAVIVFIGGWLLKWIWHKGKKDNNGLENIGVKPYVIAEINQVRAKDIWKSNILVKNIGNASAKNVYIYLAEKSADSSVHLANLGSQEVRISGLSAGESKIYKNLDIMFDGCNVTSIQEIWIDYENIDNVIYRTVINPPSPRGDDWSVEPPIVIKTRPPRIPGAKMLMTFSMDKNHWQSIRKGDSDSMKHWESLR